MPRDWRSVVGDWRSAEFWNAFMLGAFVSTLAAFLFMVWRVFPQRESVLASLQTCTAQLQELNSTATVLYEWERGAGVEVLAGLVELQPGAKLGGAHAYGQSKVRWFVPVKVQPLVYGDPQGAGYAWCRKDGTCQGPFPATAPR